jgi:hypothetical protein
MVGTLCVFTYRIKADTFFYKIETQIMHYGMLGEQEMTITEPMPVLEISPVEFTLGDTAYEADGSELEYCEDVHLHLLEAIGGTVNDWITVFQISGDGTKAEIIIGVSGQIDRFFKVTCPMIVPVVSYVVAHGWQSWVYAFLCSDFIYIGCVTEHTIDRRNHGRLRLGLEPWTIC